ncbi:MAG: hypothetical protein WB493_05710 [Anaeromyxobacteraceae bacterium]
MGNGENQGIGAALNRATERAAAIGAAWVVAFDQDSGIQKGYVARLLHAALRHPAAERPALVVPALAGDGLGSGMVRVERAITSGSLASVGAMVGIGGYREDFFIDYVDFEMCLRLRRAGHWILRDGGVTLEHRIGSPRTVQLASLSITTTNHSPIRRYYKCRNRVAMVRGYFGDAPAWLSREILSTVWEMAKILMLERGKGAKIGMMVRGVRDGLAGRMGPGPPNPLGAGPP